MTTAYAEHYLDAAMDCLGEAFDCSVRYFGMSVGTFVSLFSATGFAARFAVGEPCVVAGMSGTELALEVLNAAGMGEPVLPERGELVGYAPSPEYWCGWVLAYCQWKTCHTFEQVERVLPAHEALALYHPLHEASEERFVELYLDRARASAMPTALQRQRKLLGITQRELAERSGVNLRTLQQYENRSKDVNKAAGSTLLALSRVLGCRMEDIFDTRDTYEYAVVGL